MLALPLPQVASPVSVSFQIAKHWTLFYIKLILWSILFLHLSGSLNRQNSKSTNVPTAVCMVGAGGMFGEGIQNGWW